AVEWYFSTVRRKVFKPNFMSFYQYQRAALLELIKKHNVDSRYKGHKNVFNTTRNYNSNQDLSFCQALLTALTPKFTRGHQSKLDSRSNAADTGDKGVGAPAGNKNAVQPNTGNAGSASTTTQDQHSVQEPSTQGPSNKKLDTSSLKLFAKAYPCMRRRLTYRQSTCNLDPTQSKTTRGHPCPDESCSKIYIYVNRFKKHLVESHSWSYADADTLIDTCAYKERSQLEKVKVQDPSQIDHEDLCTELHVTQSDQVQLQESATAPSDPSIVVRLQLF
ncbi:hypothetical protein SAMD00019534_090380, partial [Acytostelium subglobosum LB1]|uniref:hypothetical protein n=1 Tax=Acytostelium subglobosum LB1 TaxID=1410327 RepID=UPI0006450DED